MTKILDGKKISQEILSNLANQIQARDLDLRLAVLSVGRNLVSEKYQEQKERTCRKIGIDFKRYGFPAKISQAELEKELAKIIKDGRNSGIVIQLPLPSKIPAQKILNLIPANRDPDCLGLENSAKFYQGEPEILPPVVSAIQKFFQAYKIQVRGKEAVVVGSGRLVGLPASRWLIQTGATVTVCNRLTKNLARFTNRADIVISGAGQAGLIKGSMIKKGAVVIDCGASVEQNRLSGDVDFTSVSKKAGFFSPVPGGVGPLTVVCLIENLLKLQLSRADF